MKRFLSVLLLLCCLCGVSRSPHAGHEAPFINESHIRIPFQENARESPCGKGI